MRPIGLDLNQRGQSTRDEARDLELTCGCADDCGAQQVGQQLVRVEGGGEDALPGAECLLGTARQVHGGPGAQEARARHRVVGSEAQHGLVGGGHEVEALHGGGRVVLAADDLAPPLPRAATPIRQLDEVIQALRLRLQVHPREAHHHAGLRGPH